MGFWKYCRIKCNKAFHEKEVLFMRMKIDIL